jgi:hypothetical protein
MRTYKFDTKAIHYGQEPLQWKSKDIVPPIVSLLSRIKN